MKWEIEDILISFDVVSLYTIVPVKNTLEIIQINKWLDTELHNLWTNRRNGMRSRLVSVFPKIVVEWFKNKAVKTSKTKPKMWFR